jgi:hypothetical protein
MSTLFVIFFVCFFLFVAAGFIATSVFGFAIFGFIAKKGLNEWQNNSKQPIRNTEARVVAKRQDISGGGIDHHHHSTWHHVTFEFATGERREFAVNGGEYGILVEGDVGILSYQGTWYKGFERKPLPVVSIQE